MKWFDLSVILVGIMRWFAIFHVIWSISFGFNNCHYLLKFLRSKEWLI